MTCSVLLFLGPDEVALVEGGAPIRKGKYKDKKPNELRIATKNVNGSYWPLGSSPVTREKERARRARELHEKLDKVDSDMPKEKGPERLSPGTVTARCPGA